MRKSDCASSLGEGWGYGKLLVVVVVPAIASASCCCWGLRSGAF